MQTEIRALTLHRPWPWAIFNAGKDVENRGYALPRKFRGQWVAIHAGKAFDDVAADAIVDLTGDIPPDRNGDPTGIVGLVKFGHEMILDSTSWWFVGPFGWKITARIRLITPIPCLGKQGFWTPERRIHDQLLTQVMLREGGVAA